MRLPPLPDLIIEPLVRVALMEDLGRAGDLTSNVLIPEQFGWNAALVARQEGVVAGLDFARMAFTLYDPDVGFKPLFSDGSKIKAGDVIARVAGRARSLLAAERTAVNYLSHLSGIATATKKMVDEVGDAKARICCTRKTTPGLRVVEKYAVRAGGGCNHRFGLDDAVLIKDNHIAVVGDVRAAVQAARDDVGHMVKIELEVDTLKQLESVLDLSLDAVLLDNMTPEELAQAVRMVDGRFVTEASGRITLDTVAAVAASGVDIISVGAITHSAPILDIALDDDL